MIIFVFARWRKHLQGQCTKIISQFQIENLYLRLIENIFYLSFCEVNLDIFVYVYECDVKHHFISVTW